MDNFPLQKIINKYRRRPGKMKAVFKKILEIGINKNKINFEVRATNIKIESIFKSQNHEIDKVIFRYRWNGDEWNEFRSEIKIYELVFADYEKLKIGPVLEIIKGFEDFLDKLPNADQEMKERNMKRLYNALLCNEKLPDDIRLWVQLKN
jgi:hypothetical protein